MMSISRNRLPTINRFCLLSSSRAPSQGNQVRRLNWLSTPQKRGYSQKIPEASRSSFFGRVSPITTILLLAGTGALLYGTYDIYTKMTIWPQEVRSDLRSGLRAKQKGDLELCERYLERAWKTCKDIPAEKFKPEPYLKTTGIAIILASVLEDNGKLEKAYDIYSDALAILQDAMKQGLSGPENLRAIAISYKLGEVAAQLERPEEEEKHLVWAVETILKSVLRLGTEHSERTEVPQSAENETLVNSGTEATFSGLPLPDWATRTDIASPLEALGALYMRAGRQDFAMPLYLQAISILIPPHPHRSSNEDRCRGAQLMSNLSELIIRSQPELTEEVLRQAETWAKTGLDIVMRAKETVSDREPTCELAFAVALFNVGALRRMAGDQDEAKRLLRLSLKQSKAIKLQTGITHAEDALRQMGELPADSPPALTT